MNSTSLDHCSSRARLWRSGQPPRAALERRLTCPGAAPEGQGARLGSWCPAALLNSRCCLFSTGLLCAEEVSRGGRMVGPSGNLLGNSDGKVLPVNSAFHPKSLTSA